MGNVSNQGSLRRRAGSALAIAAIALTALAAPTAASATEGDVGFLQNATSRFDGWLTGSTAAQRDWMRQSYERMRGYPPFFDQALSWAPAADFYIDAYGIQDSETVGGHPGRALMRDNPDWVLKDRSGNRLFIPCNCSGGKCAQYAADFGNPDYRDYFIGILEQELAKGYAGVHVDDVNLEMRVSDGNGDFVRPIDPRTGAPMTDADWSRYMAEFVEDIKAALPGITISQNPLWFVPEKNPYAIRQTRAADYVEMERGFNDQGIEGGSGTFGYLTYLDHVDWVHRQGASVVFEPYGLGAKSARFELASYLLTKERDDMITSDFRSEPTGWWSGWDVDLGAASGSRYAWRGLIRRDFSGGTAIVNQPGAAAETFTLPGTWTDQDGGTVTGAITLGAREGIVLKRVATEPTDPPPVTDPEDPPVTTEPPPTTTGPGKLKIKVSKQRVRRGGSVGVRGRAAGADLSRVSLEVKAGKGWRTVRRFSPRSNGSFRARLHARGRGKMRLRATSPGHRHSRLVRVRVI